MSDRAPSDKDPKTASSGTPLDAVVFDQLMAAFTPFETSPTVLVGVSGGADSMALCLLANDWAKARGGRIVAVTVDHGLRAGSADEAAWVGSQLARHGIDHVIETWTGPKPTGAVQENAREARYRILDDLMAARGIFHLLIAHHRDDQDETIAMRMQRGTGPLGQAGMSARRYLRHGRVLRPLLSIPKADLVATLNTRGQSWVEDPSNTNERFERVRVRNALTGQTTRAAEPAARIAFEQRIGSILAQSVQLAPNGVACIDLDLWRANNTSSDEASAKDAAIYALGHVIRTVAGGRYMPAMDPLNDVFGQFAQNPTARISLGGCVLHGRQGHVLVYREAGRMDQTPLPVDTESLGKSGAVYWDNRFEWMPGDGDLITDAGLMIGQLDLCDVFHTKAFRAALREIAPFIGNLPRAALASMPALYDKEGLRSVGGLEVSELSDVLSAAGCERPLGRGEFAFGGRWRFAPQVPMWESGFKLSPKPDNHLA